MARFAYEAYDLAGNRVSGTVESLDRDAAFALLRRRGEHPVSLHEVSSDIREPWWQRDVLGRKGLPLKDLSVLTRELAVLLKSDLPIDEAFGIIRLRRGVSARVRNFVSRVQTSVREGRPLSQALASERDSVPEFYWRLIAAGEGSGTLADITTDLAAYLERAAAVRQRIGSALTYPLLLLGAALLSVGMVTLVLIPAITPLFADAGVPLPPAIAILSAAQTFLSAHWLSVSIVGAALALAWHLGRGSSIYASIRNTILLSAPVIGELTITRETARLCHILGTLLSHGVPLVDALGASARTLGNSEHRRIIEVAAEKIAAGSSLSAEMSNSRLFSDLAVRFVSVGEKSGHLDEMLLKSAAIHEDELHRRVDRAIQYIGPLLTLLIGGFAGALILTVLNAILSINDLALR